jgi:hypothetical protein
MAKLPPIRKVETFEDIVQLTKDILTRSYGYVWNPRNIYAKIKFIDEDKKITEFRIKSEVYERIKRVLNS